MNLMEAEKRKRHAAAKLSGDFPSFTVRPVRDSKSADEGYMLYTNLPMRDRNNRFKFQELKPAQLSGTAWAPRLGSPSRVVAIKQGAEDVWLLFGTRGNYKMLPTNAGALKLVSPARWYYIARKPLSAKDGVLDSDVQRYIAEENNVAHILDYTSTQNDDLLRKVIGQLEAFEEEHSTVSDVESKYTIAFGEYTAPTDAGREAFAPAYMGLNGRPIFRLNHIPLNPPPLPKTKLEPSLWLASEQDYVKFANQMEKAIGGGNTRLSFVFDKQGRLHIPLTDKRPAKGEQDPELLAGYFNYEVLRELDRYAYMSDGHQDSAELRQLVVRARQNANMSDDPRLTDVYPSVEVGTSMEAGNNLMALLTGFMLHSTKDYEHRFQSHMAPTVANSFQNFKGDLSLKYTQLLTVKGVTAEQPLTTQYALYNDVRKNEEDDRLTHDLYSITRAMMGDTEFRDELQRKGIGDAISYAQTGIIGADWSLVVLRNKHIKGADGLNKIERGILIPPLPRHRRAERNVLLMDINAQYSGEFDIDAEKPFNYMAYMIHRDNVNSKNPATKLRADGLASLPPLNLTVKLDTTAHAQNYLRLNIVDSKGEVALTGRGKGTRSLGELARQYYSNDPSLGDERRKYFHKVFDTRYDASEKPAEKLDEIMSVHARGDAYSTREAMLEKTAEAVQHAAEIADLGGAVAAALHSGVYIREQGKDRLYVFDDAGMMYEATDQQNPQDTRYWEPVPAAIFWNDSPYMKVLKGISRLIDKGSPVVSYIDNDGNTAEVRQGQYIPGSTFAFPGDAGAKFRAWHDELTERIRDAVGGGDYLDTMQALMAFPTVKVEPGAVYDIDSQRQRISHMVGVALAIDPENMPPGLEQGKYAELVKKIKAGVPMERAMKLTRTAAENYRKFTEWVRASYMVEQNPNLTLNRQNVAQLKNDLHNALVERVTAMKRAEGALSEIIGAHRPAELGDIDEFSDQRIGLVGRATNAILDATIRPIVRWIQESWQDFTTVVEHVYGLVSSPLQTLTRTLPAAAEAFYMAAKVFFQAYFSKVIEDEFRDKEVIDSRTGQKRMVQFKKVRGAAKGFLENAVGLKAFSSHDFSKMNEIVRTGAYAEEMGNRYGTLLGYAYSPKFRNENMVLAQANNERTRIKMVGYQTKNGNAGASLGVDIPLLNPRDIGLLPGMIDAIAEAGPRGIVLDGTRIDKVPPELQAWYRAYGANFRVEKFNPIGENAVPSRDTPAISEFKLKLDNDGYLHARVKYSMETAFENHRQAYYAAFNRNLNARSGTPVGRREDDTREMIYTGRLAQEGAGLQRRMNLIEALFGKRG